nr:hypothetical protein CFP56_62020 [Quercus suber]
MSCLLKQLPPIPLEGLEDDYNSLLPHTREVTSLLARNCKTLTCYYARSRFLCFQVFFQKTYKESKDSCQDITPFATTHQPI